MDLRTRMYLFNESVVEGSLSLILNPMDKGPNVFRMELVNNQDMGFCSVEVLEIWSCVCSNE